MLAPSAVRQAASRWASSSEKSSIRLKSGTSRPADPPRVDCAGAPVPGHPRRAPVLHVADNQLVDTKLVGEVGTALLREALVQDQAARQPVGDQRSREITDRQQPWLEVIGSAGVFHEHPVRLFEKHGNRRQCGVEERQGARLTRAAPAREMSSITPKPLRMPLEAYINRTMSTTSVTTCSVS